MVNIDKNEKRMEISNIRIIKFFNEIIKKILFFL